MQDSKGIMPSVWRHICPKIVDLSFEIDSQYLGGELIIPTELRLQGAGKANAFIQEEFEVQGAFLCQHAEHTNPAKGELTRIAQGWHYRLLSVVSAGDTDSFEYQLSLNSEISPYALITINFT
jgi:hypothetical protein